MNPEITENLSCWWRIRSKALLSGMAIGIGGAVYVTVGGIVGAVLFSFGLLATVNYGWWLYTGTAGFIDEWKQVYALIGILLYNCIGAELVGILLYYVRPELIQSAVDVVNIRLGRSLWDCFFLAVLCGFMMTIVVKCARENNRWLPLLFGIPVFILCGFLHSIADVFYIALSNMWTDEVTYRWLMVIAGNFVGCNLIRLVRFDINA